MVLLLLLLALLVCHWESIRVRASSSVSDRVVAKCQPTEGAYGDPAALLSQLALGVNLDVVANKVLAKILLAYFVCVERFFLLVCLDRRLFIYDLGGPLLRACQIRRDLFFDGFRLHREQLDGFLIVTLKQLWWFLLPFRRLILFSIIISHFLGGLRHEFVISWRIWDWLLRAQLTDGLIRTLWVSHRLALNFGRSIYIVQVLVHVLTCLICWRVLVKYVELLTLANTLNFVQSRGRLSVTNYAVPVFWPEVVYAIFTIRDLA